jgi:ankyrin repeat protein
MSAIKHEIGFLSELAVAASSNKVETLQQLLSAGVDVNQTDSDGRSALIHAALAGCDAVIDVLIENGAVVDHQDALGYTALHYAAQDYQLAIAKRLLSLGGSVDICDNYGNTPLALANNIGNYDVKTFFA